MSSFASQLAPRIREILTGSNLETVSAKAVRKQLASDGYDEAEIKANKAEIDETIGQIYESIADGDDGEEPADDDEEVDVTPAATASGQPPSSSHPEPLKKKEKGREAADEAMARRMQAEFDSMGSGRAKRAAAPPAKTKAKPKKKKRSASDIDDSDVESTPKKKRGGGGGAFNKELVLSDALAAFTNETRLSRPQTVKRIWAYIKEHDLQDPSDKRNILCDDKLRSVFQQDKVHMFTMNKILTKHFIDPDQVV